MQSVEALEIFTVGHSNLSYADFIRLIQNAGVTAIADVRSAPYSRHLPHFNREALRDKLRKDKVSYVFLGHELGGRPKDSDLFCDGVADYERMVKTTDFARGLDRVVEGAARFRVALLCSEHDPLNCHRCLLVGRALADRQVTVTHILADDRQSSHKEVEARLLALAGRKAEDLFATHQERLAASYRDRSLKVAFAEIADLHKASVAAE